MASGITVILRCMDKQNQQMNGASKGNRLWGRLEVVRGAQSLGTLSDFREDYIWGKIQVC